MPVPTVKPIISQAQSVLGYLQWQAFEFLPAAVNFPTTWYCSGLPPGLYFEAATGAIFGAVVVPGVYTFVLYAENVVGLSDPVTFVLGIEAGSYSAPASILDLSIDTITRQVTVVGLKSSSSSDSSALPAEKEDEPFIPLFLVKAGDDLIVNVRYTKGGVQYDPDLEELKFALKEVDPDEPILESTEDMVKVGTGSNASFRLYVHVDGDAVRGALGNHEGENRTQLVALGEFEWTQANTTGVGPETIRGSSQTFGVLLVKDIIANPAS